jgi:15-cis-phytoene synthase
VVTTTTEPMIGQIRLTWWHEQMLGLDRGEVPADPVITALQGVIRDHDVTGAMLAALVEGWEVLLEPMPLGDSVLREYAMKRGDVLFELSARLLASDVSPNIGAGWALIDLAGHCSDCTTRERALALFRKMPIRGPKPLRILARVAQFQATQSVDQIMMTVGRWTMLRAVLS